MISVLQQPLNEMFSGNPIVLKVKTSIYEEDTAAYISCAIEQVTEEGHEVISEEELLVGKDGIVTFNLEGYFEHLFSPSFNQEGVINKCFGHVIRYRFRIKEKKGDYVSSALLTKTCKLIFGGLSSLDYNYLLQEGRTWFDLTDNHRWLTNQPDNLYITRKSKPRLYFYPKHGHNQARITVDQKLDNDLHIINHHDFIDISISEGLRGLVLEVLCGVADLNISSKAVSYKVMMETGTGTTLFRYERNFIITDKHYKQERQLIFRNSLGGYDSVPLTGEREDTSEMDRQDISVGGESDAINQTYQVSSDLRTGYLENYTDYGKEYLSYLQDLLISKEVYLLSGEVPIPVVVTTKKASLFGDNRDLHALGFSVKRKQKERYYSNYINEETLFICDHNFNPLTTDKGIKLTSS